MWVGARVRLMFTRMLNILNCVHSLRQPPRTHGTALRNYSNKFSSSPSLAFDCKHRFSRPPRDAASARGRTFSPLTQSLRYDVISALLHAISAVRGGGAGVGHLEGISVETRTRIDASSANRNTVVTKFYAEFLDANLTC